MDIKTELLKDHSRRTADRIVSWIGADAKRFRALMELFLTGEYLVTQRAAMVVGICTDRNPAFAGPYVGRMIARMEQPGVHVAVRRTVVRMLQHVDIPVSRMGKVATLCFAYLSSPDSPVAVRVFSMTVLARLAAKEPDLGRELRLVIEHQTPYGSKGYCSRAARIVNELDRRAARSAPGHTGGTLTEK